MNVRHSRLARLVALTVVVAMPLVGMAGIASASKVKAAPNCAKHPHRAACASGGGGGATGGTGGTPPNIIVSVSPDPVQEVGTSEINVVVQVEALAIFANQKVDISSQQLFSTACRSPGAAVPVARHRRSSAPEPALPGLSSTTTATPRLSFRARTVPRVPTWSRLTSELLRTPRPRPH
jgi:hypothetical protein